MSSPKRPVPVDENGLPVIHKLVRSLAVSQDAKAEALDSVALDDRVVIFVHIPKCAGRTFSAILDKWFLSEVGDPKQGLYATGTIYRQFLGPDKGEALGQVSRAEPNLRYLRGHLPYGVDDRFALEPAYVTFLRDPVTRARSHFAFGADRGGWRLDTPFGQVIRDGGILDNPMTRQLAGLTEPNEICTEQIFEQALKNLAKFEFVGLSEQFDLSLQYFLSRFNLPSVIYLDRGRGKPVDLPAHLSDDIEEFVTFDKRLYDTVEVPRLKGQTRPELWVDSTVISVEPEPGHPIPFSGLDLIKSTLAERNFAVVEPLAEDSSAS